ncbi:tetratricopeptide repeat protein [Bacteriovorax sp. DB6_IX]|nr:tetratricopeptide repeat protein [Bacteriovorax sp. DB6_IX]
MEWQTYSFLVGEFEQSYDHLQTVLKENEKYSTAYSLLGKVCEKLGRKDEAVAVYEKGIGVASSQGDMMPANEMQSALISFVVVLINPI